MPDNNFEKPKAAEAAPAESEGLNLLSAMQDSGEKRDGRSIEDIYKAMEDLAPQIAAAQKAVEEKMKQIAETLKSAPRDLQESAAEWVGYHAEKTAKN